MTVKFQKIKDVGGRGPVGGRVVHEEGVKRVRGGSLLFIYLQDVSREAEKASELLLVVSRGKSHKGRKRRKGFATKAKVQKRDVIDHALKAVSGFLKSCAPLSNTIALCAVLASTTTEANDSRRTGEVTSLDESIGSSQSEEESFLQASGLHERTIFDHQETERRWIDSIAQTVV